MPFSIPEIKDLVNDSGRVYEPMQNIVCNIDGAYEHIKKLGLTLWLGINCSIFCNCD